MRYIVELPNGKVQAIQSLVDSGKYSDLQSFVIVAVENQLYLEKQPLEDALHRDIAVEMGSRERSSDLSSSLLLSIPQAEVNIVTVPEPEPRFLSGETLWALHNRIFPIKVTLRVLVNNLSSSRPEDGYADLIAVQTAALEEARKLSRRLLQIDRKKHRVHGEKLSTALPRARDRSGDRFKLHFVGNINSKNRIEGAPAILRFVNIKRDQHGEARIGVTESGLQFARLENTILDRADYSSALSVEEASFYLRHISEKLVKEHSLSVNTLKAIENGLSTPDKLAQVVIDMYPNIKGEEAQAIRSSLASRLSELGLLTRKRTGLNVAYTLTEMGRKAIAL